MTIPEYVHLISQLDLMVGMRLHSCLIALRTGVPAININYTLKGRDIMRHLSLGDRLVELKDFLSDPDIVIAKVREVLTTRQEERARIRTVVKQAVEYNQGLLGSLLGED
jgi:polysaccharide pyruvyl transferase WcaK-like protein